MHKTENSKRADRRKLGLLFCCLEILLKGICFLLQGFQKAMHMVAVGSCVVTGDGKWQQNFSILLIKLTGFNGGEIIRLVLVAVHRKMLERDPRYAGHRIGVFRRKLTRIPWFLPYRR